MSTPSTRSAGSAALQTPASCAVSRDPAEWFKSEVHPHDGQLKSYLKAQFPSVRDVDDVVQESYLRIWKAKVSQPINSAKGFLFTIARHLALNAVRSNRRSPLGFEGDLAARGVVDEGLGAVEILTNQEKVSLLTDALAQLPATTREIILLHKFDGLSQRQTAEKLGLTEKSVERHVARGVASCTQFFRSKGHDFF